MTISGRVARRRMEGTIGGGGRLLSLDRVNGSITLKRDQAADYANYADRVLG